MRTGNRDPACQAQLAANAANAVTAGRGFEVRVGAPCVSLPLPDAEGVPPMLHRMPGSVVSQCRALDAPPLPDRDRLRPRRRAAGAICTAAAGLLGLAAAC